MEFLKKSLNKVNVQENTLYDIIYDLFFYAKLQESEEDIKNGRICTLEELRQHINELEEKHANNNIGCYAKSAITDIYNYSYNISSNYANRIVNKIYDTIYDLQDSPYIGRNVPEFSDKQFRERICEKYRIIYYISEMDNTIFIRYIFCGRQNSKLFFKVHENELINFFNQLII